MTKSIASVAAFGLALAGMGFRPEINCDGHQDVLDVRAQRAREMAEIRARIAAARAELERQRQGRERVIMEAAAKRRARRLAKRAAILARQK